MLSTRRYDDSDEGLDEWNFMTVYNWGENPKGTWRLKITDNPNQDDAMSFFGSDSGDDVETLEEQVIDTQTKLKKAQWDAMRKQDPFFDAPYPSGVRKTNVAKKSADMNNLDEKGNIPKPNPMYEKYTLPIKKGTLAVFDETAHANDPSNEDDDEHATKEIKLTEKRDGGEQTPDKALVREKKDAFEGQERAILEYYNNMRKTNEKKSSKFKKVQVQEEETGTERVQVNAGYENPRIACESGYNSCSGVVLKWVLTLYGTGE